MRTSNCRNMTCCLQSSGAPKGTQRNHDYPAQQVVVCLACLPEMRRTRTFAAWLNSIAQMGEYLSSSHRARKDKAVNPASGVTTTPSSSAETVIMKFAIGFEGQQEPGNTPMRVRSLDVQLYSEQVGTLIQVGTGGETVSQFHPADGIQKSSTKPIMSWATLLPRSKADALGGAERADAMLHGRAGLLPAVFQNLLPEGTQRDDLAQRRGCPRDDHFDILAACGSDLPGALSVLPSKLDIHQLRALVAADDSEFTQCEVAPPLPTASSLAGVQPKLALAELDGRFVASLRHPPGRHIIAKLPTSNATRLPAVEELSLRLANAAGVVACHAELMPIAAISEDIPFDLPDETHFLAVERFDRAGGAKVHCEEFAQILGIPPQEKYQHPAASYAHIATVLLQMGRSQDVEELLRRLAVNELLGNRDAHAKNFGVIYDSPRQPRLSPAYDIVAHAAFFSGGGHALPFVHGGASAKRGITPLVLRQFCAAVAFPEIEAREIMRRTGEAALDIWPALIAESALLDSQKKRLMAHLESNAIASSLIRRRLSN